MEGASGVRGSLRCAPVSRYRCNACGNLTRFDRTVSRRTREFLHYSLGGDCSIEQTEVLSENVEEVACRWCGHGKSLEEVAPDSVG